MVPEEVGARLSTNMQSIDSNWQSWEQPVRATAFAMGKEPQVKLSLETRNLGDVVIVYCQGRIVYRHEAAALSRLVGEVFENSNRVILDLTGVSNIDSAGIGELVLLQNRAHRKNVNLKCAGPNSFVRNLFGITNLDTVLEVHPSLDAALETFRHDAVYATANSPHNQKNWSRA